MSPRLSVQDVEALLEVELEKELNQPPVHDDVEVSPPLAIVVQVYHKQLASRNRDILETQLHDEKVCKLDQLAL